MARVAASAPPPGLQGGQLTPLLAMSHHLPLVCHLTSDIDPLLCTLNAILVSLHIRSLDTILTYPGSLGTGQRLAVPFAKWRWACGAACGRDAGSLGVAPAYRD